MKVQEVAVYRTHSEDDAAYFFGVRTLLVAFDGSSYRIYEREVYTQAMQEVTSAGFGDYTAACILARALAAELPE